VNDRRSGADLGPSAEAVLAAFPLAERDWERDARAVEARLSANVRGSTADALLAAPLPSEPGEPSAVSGTATLPANAGARPQSLAELARRSMEKKQSSERERARERMQLAAQERANRAEPPALGESPTVPVAPARPPSAASAGVAPRLVSRLALGISALALAAAALLWLRSREPTPLASNTPAATRGAPAAGAGSPAPAATSGPQTLGKGSDVPALASEVPAKTAEIAAPALAASPAAEPAAVAKSPAGTHVNAAQIAVADEPAKAAAVATRSPVKRVETELPPDPGLRPADSTGGELPTKPSTGAVQAALGSVMSGARRCVAGDPLPSSAVVVFGSDGRVRQVSVTGPAQGKPSGACIEAQLSHARVQPFAAPNFSVSATVRPD
jgi:hypothetical protein